MVSSRVVLGQAYENRIRWLSELETHVRGRLAGAPDLDVVAPLVADLTLGVLETAFRLAVVRHVAADEPHPYDFLAGARGIHLAEAGLASSRTGRRVELAALKA
ncbi:hypothetical protein [Amycolatopsis sp. cmx-8-4]|uniref:hypothetical protein n=1 Tax=Amycolatopsis sp. cmx-8-4 TaxID=2790947 RepID=UPI0039788814